MREVLAKGLGKHIDEAVIRRWYFEEGDQITKGDDLAELVTADDTVIVVTAPATGVLAEVYFDEGETVQRDEVICLVDDEETGLRDEEDDDDDDNDGDGDDQEDTDEDDDDDDDDYA
ncbi:MAG: branched-chain alpha-keto acid dehydrogenase subunit E2 [Candidatus Omnitrophica bacterium ADurb.Bin277]|nr:MAG: branched-chain alpha-keto acid dehydrogenase subunit E2 [Candidatus Omnitrophica bacterium ADurb.Bin277]